MSDEATPKEDGLLFGGPKYFLTHLGLFGIERVLIKKHIMPERNTVFPGALLWDDENKDQYFVFANELPQLQVSGSGTGTADDPGDSGGSLLRSGILFESPDYLIPRDQVDLFGIESVLLKKHLPPERNAVQPGALLWDSANERKYFVFANELVPLDQLLGMVESALGDS